MSKLLSKYCIVVLLLLPQSVFAQKNDDKDKKQDGLKSSDFSALSFRSIGPAVTSGRIADFAVNPKNHSEYYVATASSGVWKTVNKGLTYTPLFDGEGSYSIGCVTLDPSNPSTVWVGSGENNNQRSVAYGDGVYKSEDGGKKWTNMGLKTSEHISQIIVHPTNPNIVYVGAYGPVWNEGGERGVYKTTDGGKTWTNIKSVSSFTGCNDLLMDPRDPNVLYAAFHQRMRKVFTYIGGGPESAVYKSTDGGTTWAKVEGGLPSGDLGRIGIAISPVNPDVVYAVVEAKDKSGGIYRSNDKGASWTKKSGTYTSGNYYNEIECDPRNVDKIYITDTYYKVSTDGGATVKNLGEINKHIDNHCIWIDPNDGNHILVGCDGGIYETYDHAGTWDYKSNLPITQFYKVSTDNAYPFYGVHGGTQDNFSLGGPSKTTSANGIPNSDWYVTSLGDGFETQVDQSDPNIVYAQAQYGALSRFDRKTGEYLYIKPIEGENDEALRWNWDAPLLISQFSNNRLYFGANKIFKTDDQGNSWKVISPDLTRGLDRNKMEVMGRVWSVDAIAKNQSTDIFGQTTSIAESKFDENMIWVGTDDGLIQLTTDGGKNWTKYDNLPGVPSQSYVHQIIASVNDKNTAYVCFNHHRYGDFKPYVLKTSDAGKTWKSIASDLPVRGSVYSIAEDNVDPNLLFVGTEFGCYFTNNGGSNWIQLKGGLPTIAVRDIEIQRRENDLVIATFGRGFYILENFTSLRNIKKEDFNADAKIFPVKDALMYIQSYPLGLREKGHLGSGYFATPNPEPGAMITYFIKDDIKKLKDIRKEKEKAKIDKKEKVYYPSLDSLALEDNQPEPYLLFTIKDEAGNVVRNIKQPAKKGMHRMAWDFRYASSDPIQDRYTPEPDQLFGSAPIGHMAMPGTYTISMQKYHDGILTPIGNTVSFVCKMLDPTKEAAANVNSKFMTKVTELAHQVNKSSGKLNSMDGRLKNINAAIKEMPAIAKTMLEQAYSLSKKVNEIKTLMYGDNTRSSREFETKTSITDRIYSALGVMTNSTSAVPKTYIDSFEVGKKLFEKIAPQIKDLDDLISKLEEEVERNGGPYLGR
jgi:photosystem II stability/assembly factor-like uncharacterized protein